MHVLVTGATGLVGSHLCDALLNKGIKVSGISRSEKPSNALMSTSAEKVEMYHCDIRDGENLLKVLGNMSYVDGIFHLAGRTYMRDSPGPQAYFGNNLLGTLNILDCCRLLNIKKFVFSSSYAVYGLGVGQYLPESMPVSESHRLKPYDFYDESKALAEQLCRYYHERYGLIVAVLRYSKIYGPGLEEGVVFELIRKALANLPIEVRGDISTDFIYISDIVNANLLSFDAVSDFQVYNIGSGQECTLLDLYSIIVKLTGSQSKLSNSKSIKSHLSLDISKAKKELNYLPVKLEDGISKYIDYIKQRFH